MAVNFRYCPLCATPLAEELRDQAVRPVCPACGYTQFHDPKVAVIGLILHGGRVLLGQRAMDPGRGKWSLPGGFMDAGEMPEAALQRELLEELGMRVRIRELLAIFPMDNAAGERVGIVLAYGAVPADSPQIVHVADDVQAAGWFQPDDLPAELAFASTRSLLQNWIEEIKENHECSVRGELEKYDDAD